MLGELLLKIKTVFVNRVLKNFSPTYIISARIQSIVKTNTNALVNKQEYLFWLSQNQRGESLSETKMRVFANITPAEGILKNIQKLALALLKEFNKICKENDISYWIMGGTIIGSIRHKGFIPWDDDVDIGMMRKDYDKLKKVLENHPFLEVLEFYNFNGLYRIPKVVVKGSDAKLAMDIILFDYANTSNYKISEDASNEEIFDYVWSKQQKIRNAYTRRLKLFKTRVLDVKKTDLIKDPKKFEKATKITQKYIDKCHYQYDEGDLIVWGIDNFTSKAPDKRRIYTTSSIFPLCQLEFEGDMYPAPSDYLDMIIREAGDIWKFPNDVGKPKFFNEKQLEIEYAKTENAVKELGLCLED